MRVDAGFPGEPRRAGRRLSVVNDPSRRSRRLNAPLTMRDDGRPRGPDTHEHARADPMAKKPKKAETPDGEEPASEPKPKGSKKLVLMIAGAVALCAAGGGGYFVFGRHK